MKRERIDASRENYASGADRTLFGPVIEADGTRFRLWAPSRADAQLVIEGREPVDMDKGADGFFSAKAGDAGPGTRYMFRIDGHDVPDPASRQQLADSDGWSVVRAALPGPARRDPIRPWHETVICEVHVGTATPEGTFNGLRERLEHYRDAGFTCLEIMPLNAFPGQRNWGYDGTLIFAPETAYGTPEELRALVDRAHALGMCMVLDVVYNHFGPVHNFLPLYAPEWFDEKTETPWGPGIDFTSPVVRAFYYENARMWLGEYDFDGLRFDSVHEIGTEARELFLCELAEAARQVKPHAKLIIENVENIAHWLDREPETNEPLHYVAQWNDDIHHVLNHLVTGEPKYGYEDGDKDPIADLEKALADGFVHDGEVDGDTDGRSRDEPASRLPPDSFITYVQNHDQIGNRGDNMRLPDRLGPAKLDFLHFVTLLAPQIPLFFMGEEVHARTKFPFFVDLPEKDAEKKREERNRQMAEMFKEKVPPEGLPDPNAVETFDMAKLDWSHVESEEGQQALERFRTLADFRRTLVWPLTSTPIRDCRTARQGNALIVTWVFEAGCLTMALNPNAVPADLDCTIDGDCVSTGRFSCEDGQVRLGPWSAVAW